MSDLIPKQLSADLKKKVSFKDDQIASLEDNLSRVIDKRKEEKFIIALVLVLSSGVFAFTNIPTATGAVCLFALYIIALMALAKFFDVRYFDEIVDRVASFFANLKK